MKVKNMQNQQDDKPAIITEPRSIKLLWRLLVPNASDCGCGSESDTCGGGDGSDPCD